MWNNINVDSVCSNDSKKFVLKCNFGKPIKWRKKNIVDTCFVTPEIEGWTHCIVGYNIAVYNNTQFDKVCVNTMIACFSKHSLNFFSDIILQLSRSLNQY